MLEERTTRRLAAILAADVVGYSRMMGADEAGTLAALKRHRETVFDPAVSRHNGRIVKLIGDGTLVEFGSVVDAVNCALSVQRAVAAETSDSRIQLRIGINLGDIIIEGDDIYGDGVNVAARLEPLAEPGGICIASIVNESVGSRVEVSFRDGGEVQVKNIERPLRVWKWHPGNGAASSAASAAPTAPRATSAAPAFTSDLPSIAVLPFTNMSGDPEQEYFSDGMTEDILTDLSKIAGLLVIARNSSFAYKGKNVDIRTVGRELGVRTVLEGSIRRAANRVRITAQLIDAATGGHLWAERYDRDLTDIFAVQDEVTREIVGALRITLSPTDRARLAESGTTSIEAHDLLLRARELVFTPHKSREKFEQAVALLHKALEHDPEYAAAYAGLAMAWNLEFHNRWTEEADRAMEHAAEYADIAIAKGPNEPFAHYAAAIIYAFKGNLERSRIEADAALALSPNLAVAQSARGVVDTYAGDPLSAIPRIERAIRLDPTFSQQYLHFLGTAYLTAGKYEMAAALFRERMLLVPETDVSRGFLVSALGHLGQTDEAQRVWAELKQINPRYSFSAHLGRLPFRRKADAERIAEGVAKAGVSD
jgi:adenylate cyclase